MKQLTTVLIALTFSVSLPLTTLAMSHGSHGSHGAEKAKEMEHKGHDMMKKGQEKAAEMKQHGDMAHDDKGKHMGHGMSSDDASFVEFGKSSVDGVKATAKIKTYDAATLATMAKAGVTGTHHVMIFFNDEKAGAEIGSGMVALKAKGPGGTTSEPAMLMFMGKGFGGDVTLKKGEMYTFEVGTKLEDGNKRQFNFDYHNH